MSQQQIRVITKDYQPAAVGTAETVQVFSVKKGRRVVWASAMPLTAAAGTTNTTIELGDAGDTDGFITAIDTETMVPGTPVDQPGAYLANSGGKLYTTDTAINAKYVNGGTPGATNPKVRFTIAVVREYPV
jgi:hypothetical protein